MPKFRKKPVVIEAFQYRAGEQDCSLAADVVAGNVSYHEDGTMLIRTLEGEMIARPGDWVIRGIKGELYPCKPDIFAATYEHAEAGYTAPMPDTKMTPEQIADKLCNGMFTGHAELYRDEVLASIRFAVNQERQGWQTIETAPKDGTEVIVFHPDGGVCAAFCPGEGFAWHCMDGSNTVIGSRSGKSIPTMTSFVRSPTHWMPLPESPKDSGRSPK